MATAFILFVFCPSHALGHVALVHAIPLVAFTALGATAGRRIVAP
jgi:hypothetical protein